MKRVTTLLATILLTITPFAQGVEMELKAPNLPVKAWVLMDYESGAVLAEYNANQRLEPASLTKLMTSYIIAEAVDNGVIHHDDLVQISRNARQQKGSRMFVEERSLVSVINLIRGLIIQSGNDASVALAEHVSGSEEAFVTLMNAKARELNLHNTHFSNTNGLPGPEHFSSAYDLALLSRSLIKRFPEHYKIYSEREFTWNEIRQENRNRLLWVESSGADGIKTGHTDAAGYNLASSAVRNGYRVIAVVLGATDETARHNASLNLLNFAFHNFHQRELYHAGEELTRVSLRDGVADTVSVGTINAISEILPDAKYNNLSGKVIINEALSAPIQKNQVVGEIQLLIDDRIIYRYPAVALESIDKAGFASRIWADFKIKLKRKYEGFKAAL